MPHVRRPNKPLAVVNVHPQSDGSHEVEVCIVPDPGVIAGEGMRPALALDASASLREMYGGQDVFDERPNYVQGVARKIGTILSGFSGDGRVSMLYWAIGPGGSRIEPIGEFDEAGCATANIPGPSKHWGTGTQILPPVKHIVETVAGDANLTVGVIITDGIVQDEIDCTQYCLQVGQDIDDGKRKDLKLVLIGVGKEVDEAQLERFNDMFESTPLKGKIDLWAAAVVPDMREEADISRVIFGELAREDRNIAPSGRVLSGGREVKVFADGLPEKFRFSLPKGATEFTISTPKGDIKQDIAEVVVKP